MARESRSEKVCKKFRTSVIARHTLQQDNSRDFLANDEGRLVSGTGVERTRLGRHTVRAPNSVEHAPCTPIPREFPFTMSESLTTTSGYWYARARTNDCARSASLNPWKISNVAAILQWETREFHLSISLLFRKCTTKRTHSALSHTLRISLRFLRNKL